MDWELDTVAGILSFGKMVIRGHQVAHLFIKWTAMDQSKMVPMVWQTQYLHHHVEHQHDVHLPKIFDFHESHVIHNMAEMEKVNTK